MSKKRKPIPVTIAITYTNSEGRRAYLNDLLEQLEIECPDVNPVLFGSGTAPGSYSLFANIHRCFCYLGKQKGLCLYLQEDTRLCKDFRKKLRGYVKKHHVDTSYLYYNLKGTPPYKQIEKVKGGECAIIANASVFKKYSIWSRKFDLTDRKTKHDLFFGLFLMKKGIDVRAPIPSMVQHVGGFSAKFNKHRQLKPRQSPTFKG
jgi:hypothetical protein